MASSQKTTQYLFCVEAIWSQGKHYIMNIWDYFEQEAKKNCKVHLENTQGTVAGIH